MSATSRQTADSEVSKQNASRAQRTAEAKAAFFASLASTGAHINSELQERAENIHANEKALSKQEGDMKKETKNLAKQNDLMEKFVNKSSKQLASYGDLEPLQAGLEDDLADIEAMLDLIEEDQTSHPGADEGHGPTSRPP